MVPTPSAHDLKNRYPEFSQVSDGLVSQVLAEASPMVDDGWEVSDRVPGVLALAAHLLAMEGWPQRVGNEQGPIPSTAGREILSRRVGDVATQYAQTSSGSGGSGSGSSSEYGLTAYGRRFLRLLKLNAPAIGLV